MNRAEALKLLMAGPVGLALPRRSPAPPSMGSPHVVDIRSYGAKGDGVTDDTGALIKAIGEAAGGVLVISPGTYLVDPPTTIHLPAETLLEGMGGSGTLVLARNSRLPNDSALLTISAGTGRVRICGVRLLGNGSAQTNRIRGLVAYRSHGLVLEEITVEQFSGSGVLISDCPGAWVLNPRVRECGIPGSGSESKAEQGLAVLSDLPATDGYWGANCSLVGGVIEGCGLDGVIWTAPYGLAHGIVLAGNGTGKSAAGLWFGGQADYLTVSNCRALRNSGNGIDSGPSTTMPLGVSLKDNLCTANGRAGIQVDDVRNVTLAGNRCCNNGQEPNSRQGAGITLATNGSVLGARVLENLCSDDQATQTQRWGLQLGATSHSVIEHLVVSNNDFAHNQNGPVGPDDRKGWGTVGAVRDASWSGNQGASPTVTEAPSGVLSPLWEEMNLDLPAGTQVTSITPGALGDRILLHFVTSGVRVVGDGQHLRLSTPAPFQSTTGSSIELLFQQGAWREVRRFEN